MSRERLEEELEVLNAFIQSQKKGYEALLDLYREEKDVTAGLKETLSNEIKKKRLLQSMIAEEIKQKNKLVIIVLKQRKRTAIAWQCGLAGIILTFLFTQAFVGYLRS